MTALLGGKYVLEQRLGGGGMAEVFRGTVHGAAGFTRAVAIKRVLPGRSDDPRFAELFVGEAQICSQLSHRNIVEVYDFDRDEDGGLFLVMELVHGTSLDQLLATGPLPFPAVVHVAIEVLRGLAYAHDPVATGRDHAVIHRDVSPHNVLVSWAGEVKLSDFGIAKVRAASQASATDAVKGKPAYMSPEQANGEPLDGRSDLFAVGVMLWEMLAGRALFAGDTTQETLSRLLFAPIPSPRTVRPEVPEELARVALRLLARERDGRHATAAAAIAELEAVRDRPRDGDAALAAVLAARFADRAPRPTSPPPPQARLPGPLDARRAQRRRRVVLGLAAVAALGAAAGLTVALRGRDGTAPVAAADAAVAPDAAAIAAPAADAAAGPAADATAVVVAPGDAAPPRPARPPPPAPPADPRAANARALERQRAGSLTPVTVAQPRALDPYAFYPRAVAAAEAVLGPAHPVSLIWRDFDRAGKIDTTSGGIAQYIFVARDPATSGEHCFATILVERGAATLTLSRPENGQCRGALAPPRCTMAQLWQRALALGVPAETERASVNRINRTWYFVAGERTEPIANDCE